MVEVDKLISEIIEREGGSKMTNDPADKGGRTMYGIAERSNPEAWKDGKVTEQEAREIYLQKYVVNPGFHTIPPSHSKIQALLVDWGVNSGPVIATKHLQKVLGVEDDGVFGPQTLAALVAKDVRLINTELVIARVQMISRIVVKNPSQVKFLNGWLNRALGFLS